MAEYYFNLPPFERLTLDQRSAVLYTNPIALAGGPGTGKSMVSLYRHITSNGNGKKCQLLTYTTTLALYLKRCCEGQNEQAANLIATTLRWSNNAVKRDEVIIDEAQDCNPQIYRDKINTISSNRISYGADDSQAVYKIITDETIEELFGVERNNADFKNENNEYLATKVLRELYPNNRPFLLSRNYRNTKFILSLARNAFPNANISMQDINSCQSEGNKPVMYVTNQDVKKQNNTIINIINSLANTDAHNIAILCPWKKGVKFFYTFLKTLFPTCTRYYEDPNDFPNGAEELSNIHITTFKSAKGLEFDTVIIPDFQKAFEFIAPHFHVDWHDFYVGITRSKTNLRLISSHQLANLNDYVELEEL